MKKILTLLTVFLLLLTSSINVFADNFVSSPNTKERDEISIVGGIDIENGGSYILIEREDECVDKVVFTPYKYKETIENEKSYEQIVEAYKEIEASEDLSILEPKLIKLAHEKGAETTDLAVRYLFDVTVYEDVHSNHHSPDSHPTYVEIHVEAETLEDMVCVMLFVDGEWQVLEGVRLDPNDPTRLFIPIITGSGTYAIVVANGYNYVPGCCIIHWIILLLAVIVSIIFALVRTKVQDDKKNEEKELSEKVTDETNKLVDLIKILILIIDVIVCLILYIFFRGCDLDIIALLINYVVCILTYLMFKKDKDEENN